MSMLRLSAEQLSIIQAGLVPPLPPMALPPQMIPTTAAASHAPSSAARPLPSCSHAAATSLPLALLLPSYAALVGAGVGVILVPGRRDVARAGAGPCLCLTVGVHALAAGHSPPAQGLGLVFALLHSAAGGLGGIEGLLAAALCLSLFFVLAVPSRCWRRSFSLLGFLLACVGCGLLLFSLGVVGGASLRARSLLGLVLTGLALQALVGASRYRGAHLSVSVGERA